LIAVWFVFLLFSWLPIFCLAFCVVSANSVSSGSIATIVVVVVAVLVVVFALAVFALVVVGFALVVKSLPWLSLLRFL
jgi:hypothetical protein